MNDKKPNVKILQGPYPRVTLHPLTIKALKKGHPWITEDKFTKAFPFNNTFLIGKDKEDKEVSLIIHDPEHKSVKGRLWTLKEPYVNQVKYFDKDLTDRVSDAFLKRKLRETPSDRENYYLVFGEADFLPGLFIQVLGNNILLQYYANFWNKLEKLLFDSISRALKIHFPEMTSVTMWVQNRNSTQQKSIKTRPLPSHKNNDPKGSFTISEFGIKYNIKITENYDNGIYSDMSSIRKGLKPLFEKSKSFLNLYSYTGAFSLFALKHGAERVVSVDLSEKYLNWLESNILLNEDLDGSKHKSIATSTEKALNKFVKEKESFDLIVCDPPSASSDGKKTSQSLKQYEQSLPKLLALLESGGHLIAFINTHNVNWKKFEDKMKAILKSNSLDSKIKISKKLKLADDCPRLDSFPEGDYIKGFVLKKL
jgi:23S rRNA (cytosine1962-C5)-methyltransferase